MRGPTHYKKLLATSGGLKPSLIVPFRSAKKMLELDDFATRCVQTKESGMAKKQSSRGRKQDRARVAGGQDYEVRYEARKTN